MKLTNRIGKVLDAKTGREVIAPVEVEIETIPIRRPALSYFIALDAMELASGEGLVEIAKGDFVVCADTGRASRFEVYPPAAFERAFALGVEDGSGGAALDTDDGSVSPRLATLEGLVTEHGIEIQRLKAAAYLSSGSREPTEEVRSGQG